VSPLSINCSLNLNSHYILCNPGKLKNRRIFVYRFYVHSYVVVKSYKAEAFSCFMFYVRSLSFNMILAFRT
jgi:hypothetical protein